MTGHWDQATQTLTISGNGKIDVTKWNGLKTNATSLQLTADAASDVTITMAKDVKFPDNAFEFFRDVKAKAIEIDSAVDTSNVTNMNAMFYGTVNFTGNITFADTSQVQTMQNMFNGSKVKEVSLPKTDNLTNMNGMFWNAKALEKFQIGSTEKVINMARLFENAHKFNADFIDRNIPNVIYTNGMFYGTHSFTGTVKLRNAGNVTTMRTMFYKSSVKAVSIPDTSSVVDM